MTPQTTTRRSPLNARPPQPPRLALVYWTEPKLPTGGDTGVPIVLKMPNRDRAKTWNDRMVAASGRPWQPYVLRCSYLYDFTTVPPTLVEKFFPL